MKKRIPKFDTYERGGDSRESSSALGLNERFDPDLNEYHLRRKADAVEIYRELSKQPMIDKDGKTMSISKIPPIRLYYIGERYYILK